VSLNESLNRALWTKLRVLLYNFEGNEEPIVGDEGSLSQNPASNFPLTPDTFLKSEVVECADFRRMGMTRQGHVVFYTTSIEILADEKSLKTGMLLLCDFKTNGDIDKRLRLPPWDLQHPWN